MAVIPNTQLGPSRGGNYEYHWSGPFLEVHLLSDVGKKRQRNEDGCTLCVPDDKELARERGILLAVADGMGGVSGGDFASRLGLQTLVEEYYARNETTVPARLQEAVGQRLQFQAPGRRLVGHGANAKGVVARGSKDGRVIRELFGDRLTRVGKIRVFPGKGVNISLAAPTDSALPNIRNPPGFRL